MKKILMVCSFGLLACVIAVFLSMNIFAYMDPNAVTYLVQIAIMLPGCIVGLVFLIRHLVRKHNAKNKIVNDGHEELLADIENEEEPEKEQVEEPAKEAEAEDSEENRISSELSLYKKLYENGEITEEEYNQKRKQILKL